jgi:hypothetical protein
LALLNHKLLDPLIENGKGTRQSKRPTRYPEMSRYHAVGLHFMHYNFVRIHQSLRCTPAMAAGVTKKLWSIEGIVALLDDSNHARQSV